MKVGLSLTTSKLFDVVNYLKTPGEKKGLKKYRKEQVKAWLNGLIHRTAVGLNDLIDQKKKLLKSQLKIIKNEGTAFTRGALY